MKVIFCLELMYKGGAERVVCNLANYFVEHGNEVAIVVTKFEKQEYKLDNRVKLFVLDKNSKKQMFRNAKRIRKLREVIKEFGPDLVFAFLQEPIGRMLIAKTLYKDVKSIPTIISVRIDPKTAFRSIKRKLTLPLYNKADGYVFQTKEIQAFFNKKIQRKSIIIANSVAPSFYKAKRHSKERNKTIVSVGRLNREKNFPMLIDAFKEVEQEFPDYTLEIFGDGALKGELQQYIIDNSLTKKVFLRGNVDDVRSRIENASLFAMTSNCEGMSNALMEALALGLPCISTDSAGGGAATLIQNGVNGYLVPMNDVGRLADCIKRVIGSKELSNKLSEEALKSMVKYNPESTNKKWLDYAIKVSGKDF